MVLHHIEPPITENIQIICNLQRHTLPQSPHIPPYHNTYTPCTSGTPLLTPPATTSTTSLVLPSPVSNCSNFSYPMALRNIHAMSDIHASTNNTSMQRLVRVLMQLVVDSVCLFLINFGSVEFATGGGVWDWASRLEGMGTGAMMWMSAKGFTNVGV